MNFEDYTVQILPPKLMEVIFQIEDQLELIKDINNNFAKNVRLGKKDPSIRDQYVARFVQAALQKKDLVPHICPKLVEILVGNKNKNQFARTFKCMLKGSFGWVITDYIYCQLSGNKFSLRKNLYTPLDKKVLGKFLSLLIYEVYFKVLVILFNCL